MDSRGSLTTRKCIQSPFPDIFKGGWHRHSSHFAHPGVQSLPGWQSLASQTHLYMQFIETRKAMFLDSICPTVSIGVIAAWAQIHQKTFTRTFSYLLNLARSLEPIPAYTGQEAAYTLGRLPFCHRASTSWQTILFMSMGNLEFAVYQNWKLLDIPRLVEHMKCTWIHTQNIFSLKWQF